MRVSRAFQVAVLASCSVLPQVAQANSVDDSTSVRAGFTSDYTASYDIESQYNAFAPYAGITSSETYALDTFTGGAYGNKIEVFLLNEFAFYDGNHQSSVGNVANNFGVVDENGNFVSIVDSAVANAGFSNSITQSADSQYTFTLRSPEADFSSVDSKNGDNNAAHIVAKRVTKSQDVFIQYTDLDGVAAPFNFSFLEGDYILFMEDLRAIGINPFIGGQPWDFDYNDMVVAIRVTPLPEPSTMLLMTAGMLGLGVSRRRKLRA